MTLRANLDVPQGTTWTSPTWALMDEFGGPLPATDWTVRAQVRRRADDDEVLFDWSTDAGNVRVGTVNVEKADGSTMDTVGVTLTLTAAESTALGFESGAYDCLATREGTVYRIVEGAVRVARAVTR